MLLQLVLPILLHDFYTCILFLKCPLSFQDELMAELEELEALELDEQLLQPATTVPAEPLPSVPTKVPAKAPQRAAAQSEDDELEKLRAEMAM